MKLLYIFLIAFLISIIGCKLKVDNKNYSELLVESTKIIEQNNDFDLIFLSAVNSRFKKLLDTELNDTICISCFNELIENVDSAFNADNISNIRNSISNYHTMLGSNDSILIKNSLAVFKNHLIKYNLQSTIYCSPYPTYDLIKVFTQIITPNPQKNNTIDVLISRGVFDTTLINKIYIGGLDSAGINSKLITDTLETVGGFGKYSFKADKEGDHEIQGIFELKTKLGPKYIPFTSTVFVNN